MSHYTWTSSSPPPLSSILVFSALNHLINCCTVHRGACSFCAPLKLPDKHNALEIAEAMIDETDTGCFHTGVGTDLNFMMNYLKNATFIGFIASAYLRKSF